MNLIGMRFILAGGTFLQVKMTFDEAADISAKWLTRTDVLFFQGAESGPGGTQWAVRAKDIVAMHTYALDVQGQSATPQGQFRSGLQIR